LGFQKYVTGSKNDAIHRIRLLAGKCVKIPNNSILMEQQFVNKIKRSLKNSNIYQITTSFEKQIPSWHTLQLMLKSK